MKNFWNKFKNKLEGNQTTLWFFLAIIFINIVSIIIPFSLVNNLESWDTAGHYASVYYIKEYFWPWPNGWNPHFFAGFPQGILYPPLFHWLSVLLGQIIPITIAIKFLVAFSIIIFPFTVYALAKRLIGEKSLSMSATLIIFAIFSLNLGLASNLYADLVFGMLTQIFAWPLFFLYLRMILDVDKPRPRIWASVLLALIITTHAFASLFAGAFLLIFYAFSERKKLLHPLLKHLGLTFCLSAWWLIPFLANIRYVSGEFLAEPIAPIPALILVPLFILSIAILLKNKSSFSSALAILTITIGLFQFFPSFSNFIPIHSNRLLTYAFLTYPIAIGWWIKEHNIQFKSPLINLVILLIIGGYILIFNISPVGPQDTRFLEKAGNLGVGRIITSGSSKNIDYKYQSLRNLLPIKSNVNMADGLFPESSINGWYAMSLIKTFDKNNFVWAYDSLKPVCNLDWGRRLFGINYEYAISDRTKTEDDLSLKVNAEKYPNNNFLINRKLIETDEKVQSLKEGAFEYNSYLYALSPETSLAETIAQKPIFEKNNFEKMARAWWSGENISESQRNYATCLSQPLIIKNDKVLDWHLASTPEALAQENLNELSTEFKIHIPTDKPIPAYVKVSYFPFWHAFDEKGEEIPIYEASPHFMVVYAQGDITFKFVRPFYYYASFILSGLALLGLFVYLIFFLIRRFV